MKKPLTITGIVALALATFVTAGVSFACGGSSGQTAPPAPTDAPTVAASAGATTVQVTLSEWKIDAPTTLKAGDITFDVKNEGTTPHEFVVIKSDADPTSFPMATGGKIDEEAAGESPGEADDIDAGGEKTVTMHLDPGAYDFFCNLPGHYMSGMRGQLIVV